MDIKKLIDVILTSLNDGKATNIDVYDIKKMTSMSDYMLIASGRSRRQVSALAENLIQTVKKYEVHAIGVEGKTKGLKNYVERSNGIFTNFKKGAPVHVKAAVRYNDFLKISISI